MDEAKRQEALEFLNRLNAKDEAEEWEEAGTAVVMSTDTESGHVWFYGPFPDSLTALVWAEAHERDVNQMNEADERPFKATVHPLWRVEE